MKIESKEVEVIETEGNLGGGCYRNKREARRENPWKNTLGGRSCDRCWKPCKQSILQVRGLLNLGTIGIVSD